MRTRLPLLLVAAFAYLILPACETTKPRGPQSKSSYMPWDRPKAGQGAGALGSMMPRQD